MAQKSKPLSVKKTAGGLRSKIRQRLWPSSPWRRIGVVLLAAVLLFTALSYGVAEWYIHKHENQPLTLGTTFIPDYAQSYNLDPEQTLQAILEPASQGGLGMKQVRLVGYWNEVEPQPGVYDFSQLDWEFALAQKYGAKVSLSIGLRQPRWPECHPPDWISNEPESVWEPQLKTFMTQVIERYKDSPALGNYELENEFFLNVFGTCTNFDRSRLVSEYNLVKQLDPKHDVIVSRSNNWVGIPTKQPIPDISAVSIYKRVWDSTITHRYFEYPLPPWFYASLAGYEEILHGEDTIVHELQAEPWAPNSLPVIQLSTKEMNKSMNADILKKRIKYGQDTGMRTIDLWGAEWWYYMKVSRNDPSDWKVVQQAVAQADTNNKKLEQQK